jgi:hypothetical protein
MSESVRRARTMRDRVPVAGNVAIEVCAAASGALLRLETAHNLVVLTGRNQIRDALYGDHIAAPAWMALGTGTTTPVSTDTTLATEVLRDVLTARAKGSGTITFKYYLTSTQGNGITFREAGLFNAQSGGTLFARTLFTPIDKTASITVLWAWTVTIGAV